MELKQLRQFYEVCERGSFSAAGESLYMTQQAIGKSMKQLEEELSVLLFFRTKTGVSLTPQGKYLRSRCEHIFEYVDETEQYIQGLGAGCPIRTKISVSDELMNDWMRYDKIIADSIFDTAFIDVVIQSDREGEHSLENGMVGAVISTYPYPQEDFLTYPLLGIPFMLFYREELHDFHKKEVTLKDFRNQHLVVLQSWKRSIQGLERGFKEQNVRLSSLTFVDSIEEGISLAEAEGKVFLLPDRKFPNLQTGLLSRIPVKRHSFSVNLFYTFRKNDACQKEILHAYDFLKNSFLH